MLHVIPVIPRGAHVNMYASSPFYKKAAQTSGRARDTSQRTRTGPLLI